MPNSMFLSREFMVTDSQPTWGRKDGADSGGTESSRDLQREAAQTPQGRAIDEVWHETLGMPVPVADHRGGVYPVPAGEVGVGAYPAWGFAAPAVDPRWPPMPGTPDMEGAGQPMPAAAAQVRRQRGGGVCVGCVCACALVRMQRGGL